MEETLDSAPHGRRYVDRRDFSLHPTPTSDDRNASRILGAVVFCGSMNARCTVFARAVLLGLVVASIAACATTTATLEPGFELSATEAVFSIESTSDPLSVGQIIAAQLRAAGYTVTEVADRRPDSSEEPTIGLGTAFAVSDDGYLLTSAHVVRDSDAVKVLDGPFEYQASVIMSEPEIDLALLRADGLQPAAYLQFARSDDITLAEDVLVVGYPLASILGRDVRVTRGNIAALSGVRGDPRAIQITASVQPGNSGGPVLDTDYRVVGVVASRLSDSFVFGATGAIPQNVNFAVSGESASDFVSAVIGAPDPDLRAASIEQVIRATYLVVVGDENATGASKLSSRHSTNIEVRFQYRYSWDVIHYTLSNLNVVWVDSDSGRIIARGTYVGMSLYDYSAIVRETISTMLSEAF